MICFRNEKDIRVLTNTTSTTNTSCSIRFRNNPRSTTTIIRRMSLLLLSFSILLSLSSFVVVATRSSSSSSMTMEQQKMTTIMKKSLSSTVTTRIMIPGEKTTRQHRMGSSSSRSTTMATKNSIILAISTNEMKRNQQQHPSYSNSNILTTIYSPSCFLSENTRNKTSLLSSYDANLLIRNSYRGGGVIGSAGAVVGTNHNHHKPQEFINTEMTSMIYTIFSIFLHTMSTLWFQYIPSMIRYGISGNFGNYFVYAFERIIYQHINAITSSSSIYINTIQEYSSTISFFIGYILAVPIQHILHSLLVYGYHTINTLQKYRTTLLGMYGALTFSCIGSTILNTLLLKYTKLSKDHSFIITMYTFAIFNYYIIKWIVQRSSPTSTKANDTNQQKHDQQQQEVRLVVHTTNPLPLLPPPSLPLSVTSSPSSSATTILLATPKQPQRRRTLFRR